MVTARTEPCKTLARSTLDIKLGQERQERMGQDQSVTHDFSRLAQKMCYREEDISVGKKN